MWERVIGHVDMDSFYASVEVRDDPTLAGLPLVVGGDPRKRGVVASASYEARAFGVRSAMPMSRAIRLCPDLVVVTGRMSKYVEASRTLNEIFHEFSPAVEPLSLDEAFLDLTGTQRLHGTPAGVGEAIRRRIREKLSLTASVGISTSKFVAKLASDHHKPDGLTVVPAERVVEFVQSLPLERMWGVGPSTLRALHAEGIRTMKELAAADRTRLRRAIGVSADRLVALSCGEDVREVVPDAARKSISHEMTFAVDQADPGVLEGVLLGLVEKVARRARSRGVGGRTVQLKVRLTGFETFTRSRTLDAATDAAPVIFDTARELLRGFDRKGKAVRLLGVGITGLGEAVQLDLFGRKASDGEERRRHLDETEDAIVKRWGGGALARARTLLGARVDDTDSMQGRPQLPDEPQSPR